MIELDRRPPGIPALISIASFPSSLVPSSSDQNDIVITTVGAKERQGDTEEEKGRGLILRKSSSKKIQPGELLLQCEPYVCILSTRFTEIRCNQCFEETSRLQRCSRCKYVKYCSIQCQKKAWAEAHREECESLCKIAPRRPTDSILLMARLLNKRYKELEGKTPSRDSSTWSDVDYLRSQSTRFRSNTEESEGLLAIAMAVRKFVTNEKVLIPIEQLFDLLCKFRCNNFKVADGELREIGLGLYPLAALINHSCSPNTVAIFRGPTVSIRAIEEISPGQEICLSYIDIASPLLPRRSMLSSHFFFKCHCTRCTTEDPKVLHLEAALAGLKCFSSSSCDGVSLPSSSSLSGGEERNKGTGKQEETETRGLPVVCSKCGHLSSPTFGEISEQLASANTLYEEGQRLADHQLDTSRNSSSASASSSSSSPSTSTSSTLSSSSSVPVTGEIDVDVMTRAKEKLEKSYEIRLKALHPWNHDLLSTVNALQNICISLQDFTNAKIWSRKVLEIHLRVYPTRWPTLALQFFTCGKLERLFDDLKSAGRHLRKAFELLCLTHGNQHSLVLELEDLIAQNELEIAYGNPSPSLPASLSK